MGASSYLTRKPWGPASLAIDSSRRARASAREGVSGSIPIDWQEVAPAAPSSPRARSYVARLRNPSAGVGAYTKPERASRMSSRAVLPSTSIFAAFCSRYRSIERSSPSYTEQRKRHQRQETPRPEPGPASSSTLQSRIRRGQENAGAVSPSFLRMQRRRHKRSNELPFSMQ